MKQRILVIGIGRLGDSLVRHLSESGDEVIALDTDPANISRIKDFAHLAIIGDGSDGDVLEEIGAAKVDIAVICMGESFESSVLTLTNLLEMKVKHVAVRASTARKGRIYKSVGAHTVFYVEEDMGKFLAHRFSRPSILHEMELDSGLKLVEWTPAKWTHNKALSELNLPEHHRVQIVAIRDPHSPKDVIFPGPDTVLKPGLLVMVLGTDKDLQNLLQRE